MISAYVAEGQFLKAGNKVWITATDQIGSVRDVVDTSGSRLASFDYTPYGELASSDGAATPDFMDAGLYLDRVTGLYYSATRVYDPSVGRWLSRDGASENARSPVASGSDFDVQPHGFGIDADGGGSVVGFGAGKQANG